MTGVQTCALPICASLLDGGALTRVGSARAGEGAGNGAMVSPFAQSPLAAAALRKKERGEERERKNAK